MTTKRYLLLTAMMTAAVSVAGCSTISKLNPFDKKEANKTLATQGQRISVIAFDQKVEPTAVEITKTGAKVLVKRSRGTLALSAGPFENAGPGTPFTMLALGR
jgi:hypothetical protein